MSTQRDLVHKFKAAFEEKKFDILDSHLADDMTHQALPSSFVVVLANYLLGPWHLTAVMQSRKDNDKGRMEERLKGYS